MHEPGILTVDDWPLYFYRATMIETVDGDTIKVFIDFGDEILRRRRIRLLGYNAPETRGETKAAGDEAERFLGQLLPPAHQLYLRTHLDRTNFSRLLAWVHIDRGDGTLLNVADIMVANGHGTRA